MKGKEYGPNRNDVEKDPEVGFTRGVTVTKH